MKRREYTLTTQMLLYIRADQGYPDPPLDHLYHIFLLLFFLDASFAFLVNGLKQLNVASKKR